MRLLKCVTRPSSLPIHTNLSQGAEVVDRNEAEPDPAPGPSTQVTIDPIVIKKYKGKGKAIDIPQRTAEEEIARLTRELAFKNSVCPSSDVPTCSILITPGSSFQNIRTLSPKRSNPSCVKSAWS